MATRFYLPNSVSPNPPLSSLAVDSSWTNVDSGLIRDLCGTTKTDTDPFTGGWGSWPTTSTSSWVNRQYQTKGMAEGYSWTTSDTVSMVVKAREGISQLDTHLAYCIRVVSSDGGTIRGTIGSYRATSTEFPTTAATRIHSARTNGATNFTSYAGDRIIIEVGWWGVTPSQGDVVYDYWNDNNVTDYALTEGLTTDLCPWVELSRTVTFGTNTSSNKGAYLKGAVNTRYNSLSPFTQVAVTDNFNRESLGSDWTITDAGPVTSGNMLSTNGGGLYYNKTLMNRSTDSFDFYYTINNLHSGSQYVHTYNDYFWGGTNSACYRLNAYFVKDTSVQLKMQYQPSGGSLTDILGGDHNYTYNSRSSISVGVRHLSNGYIGVYLDSGNGWGLKFSGTNTSISPQGYWKLIAGGDVSGDAWIDDFGIGLVTVGSGGLPAFLQGNISYTVSGRKYAYLLGGTAGTTVSGRKYGYVKGISQLNISNKISFTNGLDNPYRPSADILSSGTWLNESGSAINLFESINEVTSNDNDFIYPNIVVTGKAYECAITSPLSTPGSGNVILFWRGRDKLGLGKSTVHVELKQGTTVISSGTQLLTSTPTTYYFQLTPAQRASITDWNNLRIRFNTIIAS